MTSVSRVARNLFAFFVFLTIPVAAQTGLGTVTGTVQDPSKAAIVKAAVTLTNTATGVVRTADVNSAGIYYFGSVQVGPYHMAVEAPGFQQWATDFQVQAGQTITGDPSLTVGSVQTTV